MDHMKNNKHFTFKKSLILLLFLCISAQPILCLYNKIEQINIKSFDQKLEEGCPERQSDHFNEIIEKQKNASALTNRSAVFAMLRDYEEDYQIKEDGVIGDAEWNALNILGGTRSKPDLLLGNKIDKAQLELGKVELLALIANPTKSVPDICKRQNVIKELVENRPLFEKLQNCFGKLKASQSFLYSFWNNDEFDGHIRSYIATSSPLGFLSEHAGLKSVFETNSTALQASTFMSHGQFAFSAVKPLTEIVFPLVLTFTLFKYPATAQNLEAMGKDYLGVDLNPPAPTVFSTAGIVNRFERWRVGNDAVTNRTRIMVGLGLAATGAWSLITLLPQYKSNLTLLKYIHFKLRAVADFVFALKELEQLIQTNDILKESFAGATDLNETLHAWPDVSSDFKILMNHLNSNTFKSEFSTLSHAGRVLASYFLMAQHKSKLVPGLRALGQMDAYMSCARLYNEGQGKENTWSFVEFVDNPTPFINIRDYWNPFYENAVANSLCVGCQGNPKSAIITGPNAGGKSSNVKNLGILLILGQSIGIVPGHLTCTPFAKIVAHMNIVDDMAEGKSHFVASVVDTRRPMNIVKSAQPGEFIVIITDEMFNDTRHEEGQAAAFSIIEFLGKHPQTICLSATHFPLLTELEKLYPGLFRNYKVSVIYDAQGKIIYPFKLEPGISHQNVAFDILRQEGFDDEFLARAQEIIKLESNKVI